MQRKRTITPPTFFTELCPFEIFAMKIVTNKKMNQVVWPHLNVFWLNKDDSTEISEGLEEEVNKRKDGQTILRSGQGST